MASTLIARVTALSTSVGEHTSMVYCIIECADKSEAHGAALVASAVAEHVQADVRRTGAALVGKSSAAVIGDVSSQLSSLLGALLPAAATPVARAARAVLVDAAWSLLCRLLPWWQAVCDLGPRGVATACCAALERVASVSRVGVEALLRTLEPERDRRVQALLLSRRLEATYVLTASTFFTTDRLRRAVLSAVGRSFRSFCVSIDGELELDAARLKLFRTMVGDDAAIEIDAHGLLLPATAFALVQRLAAVGKVSRVLRPFAAVDVIAHRELQAALDAAAVAVVVCPASCHAPLLAKQYAAEPTIRELALEWRDECTASELFTVLMLCATAGKGLSLLAETQLETLRAVQFAALSTALLDRSTRLRFCDEDAPHRFTTELAVEDGCVVLPTAAGVFGRLSEHVLSQMQPPPPPPTGATVAAVAASESTTPGKRARVDEVPESAAAAVGAVYDYASASFVPAATTQAMFTSYMYADATRSATQCYGCKQFGHMMKDCPAAAASGSSNKCFQCGQSGHWASQCPMRLPKGVCYTCGNPGHIAPNCPSRPAGAGAASGASGRCFKCNGLGHQKSNCPMI